MNKNWGVYINKLQFLSKSENSICKKKYFKYHLEDMNMTSKSLGVNKFKEQEPF